MTNPMRPELNDELIQAIDNEVEIITLVTGQLENGMAHYAYVLIKPSRYQAFKAAEAKGHYDLADYGTIVAHGEGLEPPEDIKKRMVDEYGADHYFEDELKKMIEEYNQFSRNAGQDSSS